MSNKMRIEGRGKLLFTLDKTGTVEILRDGWLFSVDIAETLRIGKPVVSKTYVGKSHILTSIDKCDKVSLCSN